MKRKKEVTEVKNTPVAKVYYCNYAIILRTEREKDGIGKRFDKKNLSEDDLDRIIALA